MANTIFVRSATKDRKVALSEGDPLHPTGEAWVVGYPDLPDGSEDAANIVEVGLTALVRQKLASGDLIEVDKPMARQQAETPQQREDRLAEQKQTERETQASTRAAEKQK